VLAFAFSLELSGAKPRPGQSRLEGLPLIFEPNSGQAPGPADFLGRANGYTALLSADRLVLAMNSPSAEEPATIQLHWVGADPKARAQARNRLPGHSNYFTGSNASQWLTRIPHYATVEYERIYPGVDVVYYGKQGWLGYDFRVAPHADANRFDSVTRARIESRSTRPAILWLRLTGKRCARKNPRFIKKSRAQDE
jgi:hypothetical protein